MWWTCLKRLRSQMGDSSWCLSSRLTGSFCGELSCYPSACVGFLKFPPTFQTLLDVYKQGQTVQRPSDPLSAPHSGLDSCLSLSGFKLAQVSISCSKSAHQDWLEGTKFSFSCSPEKASDALSDCSLPCQCFLLLREASEMWEEQSALGGCCCNRGDCEGWHLHGREGG